MILSYIFFTLLGIAIILAWTGIDIYKKLSLYIFLTALVLGVSIKHISLIGIGLIATLGTIMYLIQSSQLSNIYKGILHIALCLFYLGFSMHFLPGFHNWKILDGAMLSKHSLPYTMYLNVEKPIFIFLFMYFNKRTPISQYNWHKIIKWAFIAFFATFMLLLVANYAFNLVQWDPKLPTHSILSIWILRMLLDTALGEELFFRGYLQRNLSYLFSSFKLAPWLGCILTSLVFGALHLPAGIPMGIMATLAGIGYGLAYLKTNTIEAPTLTHFLVNVIHLLFFSYPMLASAL
jgi:membrane protease YdiL (CAAX protease family)